jgi:redox-sensitive bicupin YhaK (pirin superfamily)
LQVVRGAVRVNGHDLDAGTGVAAEDEPTLTMAAQANGAELLLFDLP